MRCVVLCAALMALLFSACGGGDVQRKYIVDTGVDDSAAAIVGDGDYIYVVGTQTNPQTGRSVGLVQILTGKAEPVRRFAVAEGSVTVIGGAIAQSGSIYACGTALLRDTNLCLVARVRPTGAVMWKRGLVVGEESFGNGVCPVPGGRIAVCGAAISGDQRHVLVAVLDTSGTTVWSRGYDLDGISAGLRVVADTAGFLVVTGNCGRLDSPDIFVMRLRPDGETLWVRRYDSGGEDYAGGVALGPLGHAVVTGTARVGDSARCVMLSYDPGGQVVNQLAFGPTGQSEGHAITVTPEGRYYVTGRSILPGGSAVLAFHYVPDAVSVWQRTVRIGSQGTGCAILAGDDVWVAATVDAQRTAGGGRRTRDIAVLALRKPQ